MNILILNGSPKGNDQTTLYTSLYLQALHPEHTFKVLNVGQKIKAYEKDFTEVREALKDSELIIFSYPVYTFIAPYQVHRLIELIKADGVDLTGKYASQITTSKHFYDVTAHRFIEENCCDLGLKVIRGLQADMDDLLTEKGQKQARDYFEQLMFQIKHNQLVVPPLKKPDKLKDFEYESVLNEVGPLKDDSKDIVIITNYSETEDVGLWNMVKDFQKSLKYSSRTIKIKGNKLKMDGGCLGCFNCAMTGKCVYKDNFDSYLRDVIQKADGFVYAFKIENHYAGQEFKCFDDRQFCNGHRTVTSGKPVAYLISGDYTYENNLRTILEARSEVGGNYLVGVATDEFGQDETSKAIKTLASGMELALEKGLSRPANFYGVGGMKIFRDLIYVMQGLMKADHKFYKKHGIYDFPQKQHKRIMQMKLVGMLIQNPSVRKKIQGNMTKYMVMPYEKAVEDAAKSNRNTQL